MRLLLDTHVLLWAGSGAEELTASAFALLADPANQLLFSSVSVWEIAIKMSLPRPDFRTDPSEFRETLLRSGYLELPINSLHGIAVAGLPPVHKDPFDRILIAQAIVENVTLVTADADIGRYPGPIELIRRRRK